MTPSSMIGCRVVRDGLLEKLQRLGKAERRNGAAGSGQLPQVGKGERRNGTGRMEGNQR